MSRDAFELLRTAVLADERLQDRLRAGSAQGGDAFVAAVVAIGAERRLAVDADDVATALDTARGAWLERLVS